MDFSTHKEVMIVLFKFYKQHIGSSKKNHTSPLNNILFSRFNQKLLNLFIRTKTLVDLVKTIINNEISELSNFLSDSRKKMQYIDSNSYLTLLIIQ